jgi:rod shape-determining protein MreC
MAVVDRPPPPFFNRGPAPLVRLLFYVCLSAALLVLDLRFHMLEWMRHGVGTIAYPLQMLAYAPVEGIEQGGGYLSSVVKLRQDNLRLREKQLGAANLLLRQEHLELENERLRALLDMQQRQPLSGVVAEILYAARDPFSRRVIINRGSQQDIAAGQVAVDELGVIGQITRVYPMLAEITLITDKDQAVPVQIVRNGLRAVLFGSGDGNLELRFLAANADVQIDDQLVTSGLDGIYQPGLPVATVKRVDRDTTYAFARIHCEPVAGVERYGMALILGRREAPPPPPQEPEEQEKPMKTRKGRH